MSDPLSSLHSRWPNETRFLGQVFNDTAASYKFYWLLGLLTLVRQQRAKVFPQTDIVKEMLVAAWHPVCFYRLSLGAQDKLQEAIIQLRSASGLQNDAKPTQIRPKIESTPEIHERIQDLTSLVPTRFLSPWFGSELRGIDGHTRTKRIIELAAKTQSSSSPSPYFFERVGNSQLIKMNESWVEFFTDNAEIIRSFAFFHLCKYLQARNPNVPGIVNKLTVPGVRDLSKARRFWRTVRIQFNESGRSHLFHDIYSGQPLEDAFSIDHFLPWSFVAHDLLWNLTPVSGPTNSMKGDSLPDVERYLPKLCELHHEAVITMRKQPELLEDYTNWLMTDVDGITTMPIAIFAQQYRESFEPQFQIARNQGFQSDWSLP